MRIKPNLRNAATKPPETKQGKANPPKVKAEQPNPPKARHSCGHGANFGMPCLDCTLRAGREYRKKRAKQVCFQPGRLPHGSVFTAEYNAETEEWQGTLRVDGSVYEGKSASVHHLLRMLGAPHIKPQEEKRSDNGQPNGEGKAEGLGATLPRL
jgi:hypothetical protein